MDNPSLPSEQNERAERKFAAPAEATRNSHHQCLISYPAAMFRLMMFGMSPANADRFLRCLPLTGAA